MNIPLVSVVMAAYNEERYIHEAIESVLKQTYLNFEFIIINDGSTDKTEDIILSYQDNRIKYIKNEQNIELIASLNKGLLLASGKYIARMDADDICFYDRLEKQVKFMEANPEIGISGAQLITFGNTHGKMNYPINHEDIKLHLLITSCFGNNVVIFRQNIFKQFNLLFPKGYLHAEDYKCWTNWIMHTNTENLDEPLVKYRSHNESVSIQNRTTQRLTRNRIRAEYLSIIFEITPDSRLARDFTGNITLERVLATKEILKINFEKNIFPPDKFEQIVLKLWYLDCLEKAETDLFAFVKFVLIFKLSKTIMLKNIFNIFKHYFKIKFRKNIA